MRTRLRKAREIDKDDLNNHLVIARTTEGSLIVLLPSKERGLEAFYDRGMMSRDNGSGAPVRHYDGIKVLRTPEVGKRLYTSDFFSSPVQSLYCIALKPQTGTLWKRLKDALKSCELVK